MKRENDHDLAVSYPDESESSPGREFDENKRCSFRKSPPFLLLIIGICIVAVFGYFASLPDMMKDDTPPLQESSIPSVEEKALKLPDVSLSLSAGSSRYLRIRSLKARGGARRYTQSMTSLESELLSIQKEHLTNAICSDIGINPPCAVDVEYSIAEESSMEYTFYDGSATWKSSENLSTYVSEKSLEDIVENAYVGKSQEDFIKLLNEANNEILRGVKGVEAVVTGENSDLESSADKDEIQAVESIETPAENITSPVDSVDTSDVQADTDSLVDIQSGNTNRPQESVVSNDVKVEDVQTVEEDETAEITRPVVSANFSNDMIVVGTSNTPVDSSFSNDIEEPGNSEGEDVELETQTVGTSNIHAGSVLSNDMKELGNSQDEVDVTVQVQSVGTSEATRPESVLSDFSIDVEVSGNQDEVDVNLSVQHVAVSENGNNENDEGGVTVQTANISDNDSPSAVNELSNDMKFEFQSVSTGPPVESVLSNRSRIRRLQE